MGAWLTRTATSVGGRSVAGANSHGDGQAKAGWQGEECVLVWGDGGGMMRGGMAVGQLGAVGAVVGVRSQSHIRGRAACRRDLERGPLRWRLLLLRAHRHSGWGSARWRWV